MEILNRGKEQVIRFTQTISIHARGNLRFAESTAGAIIFAGNQADLSQLKTESPDISTFLLGVGLAGGLISAAISIPLVVTEVKTKIRNRKVIQSLKQRLGQPQSLDDQELLSLIGDYTVDSNPENVRLVRQAIERMKKDTHSEPQWLSIY